jgi:hypothetical protein
MEDPAVPDGFFPRIALERLGIEPDVVPGGHLLALANAEGVANYLLHRVD